MPSSSGCCKSCWINTQRINRIVQDVMQLNRRDRAQPEVF